LEYRTPAQVRADLSINGIGSDVAPTITNLNTLTVAGNYHVASGATGSPNPDAFFRLIHLSDVNSNFAGQIAQEAGSNRLFSRHEDAGVWGAWVEIPRAGSIAVADFAAAAVRLSSEGSASPLDTELPTVAWVNVIAQRRANLTAGAIGEFIKIEVAGVNYTLPSGGTYLWSYMGITSDGTAYGYFTGIDAGGTTIFSGAGSSNRSYGWAWRIA
jgi:hypothetical protein